MPSPLQTEDELLSVKEFLILPVMLDVLERDAKAMQDAPLKFAPLYAGTLRSIQDAVTARLYEIKILHRQRGIKVYESKRTKDALYARYLCRGYDHTIELLWDLVRSEIETKLAECLRVNLEAIYEKTQR